MRADPIRQTLRPGCLCIGEVGRAQHGNEDLGLAHHAGHRIGDRDPLAREVDERLVAGNMARATAAQSGST